MINTLKAPLQIILIGLRKVGVLKPLLCRYWNWRVQRNLSMLKELEELQSCLRNHPSRDKKDCLKVESLINCLHHANSSAYMELFKLNGVGGVV